METPSRLLVVAAVATAAVAATAPTRTARADVARWTIHEILPGEPTEKDRHPPPIIKVRVVGEKAPPPEELDKWTLKDVNGKLGPVKAIKRIPFHESSETLALAVLVEGHEYYFGNDKYIEEGMKPTIRPDGTMVLPKKRSAGVYDAICQALDAPGAKPDEIPTTISRAGPPGSKGVLIVYSDEVDIRYPMGDLAKLGCDKLGSQELQRDKISRRLAEGLREAHRQLKRVSASRKVLFVISDGFDSGGLDEIKSIEKSFEDDKIDIYAFHLEADSKFIPGDDRTHQLAAAIMKQLGSGPDSDVQRARDAADLTTKIAQVVSDDINNRFYLLFPGQAKDPKTKVKTGMNWDQKEHELDLLVDGESATEKTQMAVLAPEWGQSTSRSRWWLWLLIIGGLLLIVVVVLSMRSKQPEPVPLPVPAPAPPQPAFAPPPVAAPQPQRTMAIDISGGDGLPVVGWLVPMTGPQQYQTFKMVPGVTKVGNQQGAHIVLNDGFMSGDHAHVAMSPQGFTLVDNNSTNGTFVNEKRVQRHELIDNDVITFGKTSCKFKTILN